MKSKKTELTSLPAVHRILDHPQLQTWHNHPFLKEITQFVLSEKREALQNGRDVSVTLDSIAGMVFQELTHRLEPRLKRVINGTGIIIHTNLGRAPLSVDAVDAIQRAATSYSTLEYDIEKGKRGSRHFLVHHLLKILTGAEDALVTNNNAAALLLALTALAKRREVIVSRGQLVEIGGSFRIPDVCRAGGVKLREVGTTNRTRIEDYEEAISSHTALLLRVHTSNYRITGFTEETSLSRLVKLGEMHDIPVVDDLGSGALAPITAWGNEFEEPLVSESVETGASVVTFSGDKLLGGPQAGIAVGSSRWISKLRKHPLMRALRPDKLTFAALDATLRAYLSPDTLDETLPVRRMLTATPEDLEKWVAPIREVLWKKMETRGVQLSVEDSDAFSGGGSLPQQHLPSKALTFHGSGRKLKMIQKRLRLANPGMIGYIKGGTLRFDARTMIIEPREKIVEIIRTILRNWEGGGG